MRVVHVAVAVILDPEGRVLLTRRAEDSHQGGLWEFPGGKVETEETLAEALSREIREELALEVRASTPLIKVQHDYGDKQVLLDVHLVRQYCGEPVPQEAQPMVWAAVGDLGDYLFPAANKPIVELLSRLFDG